MGTRGTAAGGCPSPTAPAELPPAPARCCARHSAPAPHAAPLRAWGNRCGARGLLTSVSIGSTSIPFHSSSRWAIGMLPGDASQEERRNETQLRKRRPRRAEGGAEAPERDPARDPPPARQDGSAPPSPELRGGRRRAAPLRSPPAPRPKLRPRLRCGAAIATVPPGLRGPAVPSPGRPAAPCEPAGQQREEGIKERYRPGGDSERGDVLLNRYG